MADKILQGKLDNRNRNGKEVIDDVLDIDPSILDEEEKKIAAKNKEEDDGISEETEEEAEDNKPLEGDDEEEEIDEDSQNDTEEEELAEEEQEEENEGEKNKAQQPQKSSRPSLKDRYTNSTQEAQIQLQRNKQLVETIENSLNVSEPTQEQLDKYIRSQGGDPEMLTDFEKNTVKKLYMAEEKDKLLRESIINVRKTDEWANTVDTFIEKNENSQKFKLLIGKSAEFKQYCMKSAHRGVDINLLANSFLYTMKDKPKSRGSMFLHGGGKPIEGIKEKDNTSNFALLRKIRETDPKRFRQLIKSGKARALTEI